MLERLNKQFRIIDRRPALAAQLRELSGKRLVGHEVVELYTEVGEVDIEGPEPRYFRFWTPGEILEIDETYGVSRAISGALPIGSDGGGKLIVVRDGRLFSVGYGALAEASLVPLADSLGDFLENPEPLWSWLDE